MNNYTCKKIIHTQSDQLSFHSEIKLGHFQFLNDKKTHMKVMHNDKMCVFVIKRLIVDGSYTDKMSCRTLPVSGYRNKMKKMIN